ncbi:geranylgeranyl pyrophosphate synthetase [Mortierella sp. AD094]|nr:geranylgeranyl pyrophosphate synthetase [Mortierella sp. AD094]
MAIPTNYPATHDEAALLEPYTYISSNPGKEMRTELIEAFNVWTKVPPQELAVITKVIKMLHTASLLVDDIEDDSVLRRGVPVAHKIFGIPATINCANYVYFLALAELNKIPNPKMLSIFTEELLSLHRGQGMELLWRDSLTCPSEEEYIAMVNDKTGGLLRLAVKLMQAASDCKEDYVRMVELIGIHFQIRDDYLNLQSTKANLRATEGFDLTSKVQEFLESNRTLFLILGDSGAGKSTFNRALEISLWDKYQSDGRIPLFIHLPTLNNPERDLIAERLRQANFTENQILEPKLHREFILICDGYDEIQNTRNLYMSNRLNQPGEWCVQMLISCRTEYNGIDYKDCFQPNERNNGGNSELFQETNIMPFDKDQIQDYIDQYVSLRKPTWGSEDYQQALKKISNLQDLVKSPFLLKLSLEVLPKLFKTNSKFSTARITRVLLYDAFIAQWIERGKTRLREMDVSYHDMKIFKQMTDSWFKQHGITYLKELVEAIYDNQGGNPVVNYSEHRDRMTWKKEFFSDMDGRHLLRATNSQW